MNTKAQGEIMGLIVIVMIVMVGALVALNFALSDDGDSKAFKRKGVAQGTMDALWRSNVRSDAGCGGYFSTPTFAEIAADCIENKDSPEYSSYQCGSMSSCDFFNKEVGFILNSTLGKRFWKYELSMGFIDDDKKSLLKPLLDERTITAKQKSACPISRKGKVVTRDSGFAEVSTSLGTIQARLRVCN